jgi:ferredoxin-like protein FixX
MPDTSIPIRNTYYLGHPQRSSTYAKCDECGLVFILDDETSAAEWAYGHDCQPKKED